MITAACQQMAPVVGAHEFNRAAAIDAVDQAVAAGARLVVLPELVTSGYSFATRAEVEQAALAEDDDILGRWHELIAPVDGVVVAGVPIRGPSGVRNAAVVIDARGLRAIYDKVHLWADEARWFTPGERPPPVVETSLGRIGVLVCYDLEFPEMSRSLALRGADLIAVPTNWPLSAHPPGERPPEIGNAMALARLSRVAIACADRCGDERGVEWTGGSCIIDADGWVRAERVRRDAGLVIAAVDPLASRDKHVSASNDVISDRRPAVYDADVSP